MSAVAEKACRRVFSIALLCIAIVLGTANPAAAQDVRRGISISASLAYAGGAPDGTAAALREAGFGDVNPGDCGWGSCYGPTAYPQTYPDHLVSSIGARYRHSNALSAELMMVSLPDRSTEGYRHDGGTGFGAYSSFERRGKAIVATVARHWKGAWFGAGPALVRSEWLVDHYIREKTNSVGIALDAGIVFGRRSRFAPMLRAQYRAADGGSVRSETSGVRAHGPSAEFHVGLGFGFAL